MKKLPLVFFFISVCGSIPAISQSSFSFDTEKEAKQYITLITEVVGLKPNFQIKAGKVDNASAVIYNGNRFIIYNPVFIAQIKNAVKTDWGGISILAHEVGHHLNGHTLMGTGSLPALELEADEFSGFVLRKMGATLSESQAAMRLISSERASQTHPARKNRLASIEAGWKRADIQIASSANGETKPRLPKPEQTKPQKQEKIVTASYNFPTQYILRNVHLYGLPEEKLLITVKHNFIRVTKDGYQVLGKLVKSGDILYLALDKNNHVKIDNRGYLLNSANKKIGYLTKSSTS